MKLRQIAWRRELLLLSIVAMDALWLTPWMALLLGSAAEPARRVPGPAILALLLLALATARALGASPLPLGAQQLLCGVFAIVSGVCLGGLCLYSQYPFHELDWLLEWASGLGGPLGPHSVVLLFLALYAWWRGISLAQSRLGSDSVGFCFRLGIVAWLFFYTCGIFLAASQPALWLLLFFALGLLAVGLARIEEVRHERGAVRSPFTGSWLAILGGAAAAVVGLGLVATFGVTAVSGYVFRWLLVPLGLLLDRVLPLLVQAFFFLLSPILEWLFRWLSSALAPAGDILNKMAEATQAQPTPAPVTEPTSMPVPVQAIIWVLLALGFLAIVAIAVTVLQRRSRRELPGAVEDATWERAGAGPGRGGGLGAALGDLGRRLANALGALRPAGYSLASVHEIYASLQRLAAWKGVARDEAETPYEYERQLDSAWPGAGQEVGAVTDAYVRAHYGRRQITADELAALRSAWQRLRQEIEGSEPPKDEG